MPQTKHTPGPWSVNRDPKHNRGEPVIVWGPRGPGRGAVAYTFSQGLIIPEAQREEVEANARLIAESPELCERLGELVALAEMSPDNVPGEDLYVEILLAKESLRRAREGGK
jgi:hypothetical protein